MTTQKLIITVAAVAALGGSPAVASATGCPSNGENCRIALNHNEVLDRS